MILPVSGPAGIAVSRETLNQVPSSTTNKWMITETPMTRIILAMLVAVPIVSMAAENRANAHLKSRDYFKLKMELKTRQGLATDAIKLPTVQAPYKLPAV